MKEFTPKKLKRDEQIALAYEMRIESYSFAEIGAKLGVSKTCAYNMLQEAKAKYEELQETNLNHLRNMRIQQIEKLIRSRLTDLEECKMSGKSSYSSLEDEMTEQELLTLARSFVRDRAFIVNDLLKLYQELSKLQGLYEIQLVNSFIDKKEANINSDINSLSDDELLSLFNDLQRKK